MQKLFWLFQQMRQIRLNYFLELLRLQNFDFPVFLKINNFNKQTSIFHLSMLRREDEFSDKHSEKNSVVVTNEGTYTNT